MENIADAVFAAHAAALILQIKNHIVGSNLGPDHVVKRLKRLLCHEEFFKPWVISVVSFR
jgi:hypothetical protein